MTVPVSRDIFFRSVASRRLSTWSGSCFYYPQPTPDAGFRKIAVDVVSNVAKKWGKARPAYRPRGAFGN